MHIRVLSHLALLCAVSLASTALAQTPAGDPDSSHQVIGDAVGLMEVQLPGVVVVADRIPLTVWDLPAAVSVRTPGEDRMLRYRSLTDLAVSIPGFRAYPTGNPWGQSTVDVRGFYGGGQAQYLMVSMDGIPLNDMSSGLVQFSDIALHRVSRVEAARGPVSAQYGDFGMGGMLALYSDSSPLKERLSLSLVGSADDGLGSIVMVQRPLGPVGVSASGGRRQNHGWREHSRFEQETAFVRVTSENPAGTRWSGVFSFAHTDEELPGAMSESQLAENRAAVARDVSGGPLKDRLEGLDFAAGVSGRGGLGRLCEWSGKSYLRVNQCDRVVTTTQALNYDPEVLSGGLEAVLDFESRAGGRAWRTSGGISADYGHLAATYREYPSDRAIVGGSGRRVALAAFAKSRLALTERLAITAGLRLDQIETRFEYDEDLLAATPGDASQSALRLSPSAAVSLTVDRNVNLFAVVSGAFKAPTLVHLYSSAPFNAGPPDLTYVLLSNSELEPMTGTTYEAGLKVRDGVGRYGTLSVYHYRLRDEIDYDPATIRYINVGRSHHTGIEIAGGGPVFRRLTAEWSGSYTRATIRSGDQSGHRLSGVPEWIYSAGARYAISPALDAGLQLSGLAGQYLDAANTRQLRDYAVVAVTAGYTWQALRFAVRVDNVLNREYEYDGYFDPLLVYSGQAPYRYYPAAPRQVTAGLQVEF